MKIPLINVKEHLLMNGLSPGCNTASEHCLINPQTCEDLKAGIQELMNQGIIVAEHLSTIEYVATLEIPYDLVQPLEIPYDLTLMTISVNSVVPLTIVVPSPFPYEDTKEVPWIYDSIVYIHGQKVQDEPLATKEPTFNITETGGVTRNGRIFAPVPPVNDNGGTSGQDRGKQIENSQQG